MNPPPSPWSHRVVLFSFGGLAIALLLAPDATPAVPPRQWLVWALVTPAILSIFWRFRASHIFATVLFAVAAEHLLLSPGEPRGHDLLAHSWGLWAFFQAMHAGDPTPQWLHHLSLGLPLPLFYSPATYYSLTPFYWAGFSAVQILKSAFVLHAIVGALGMYFLGRRWTGSSRAGVVAAAAFAFAPYRLLDAHYRMAIGESAALALIPLLFGLVFDPAAWSRRRVALTGLVTGGLILVHPLSVLTCGVAAVIWQGIEVWRMGSRRSVRPFAARCAAALLGLALAGAFVVPLVFRVSSISLGRAVDHPETGEAHYALQGLRLSQPFHRMPWRGVHAPEPRGNPRDQNSLEMPPYLGWGLVLGVVLSAGIGWHQTRRGRESLELPVAILAAVSIALTLSPAATALARFPLLPNLQFPWRFLGPATWAGALGLAFVARWLLVSGRRRMAPAFVAAMLALVVADSLPFTGAGEWVPAHQGFVHLYMKDPNCGERWGCWETESAPGPPPIRVYGGFLPPDTFGVDVAHVKPGFGEYLNPRALNRVLGAARHDTWAGLGAGWFGALNRPGVTTLDAVAYARWFAPGSSKELALEFHRQAGTIEVHLPEEAGRLIILEQHQPGWQARLDLKGQQVDAVTSPTPDGMIQVDVPAGATRARLHFRVAGWDVTVGRLVTLLALAVCLALLSRLDRRSRSE